MSDHRRFGRKIEPKSAWAYIVLQCGRISTPEEQEFYGVWKPRRGAYYCEICHHWHDKMKGVLIASQGAEGQETRHCTCNPGIPQIRKSDASKSRDVGTMPMRVATARNGEAIRTQIPLPGMPGEGTR